MDFYTGWQYLLIDAATHYGLDKLLFEERIKWATDNLGNLESLAPMAETKPLYLKAVMAIRKAQAGRPTGHLVGLDATCSGIQIMSCLTGCTAGATATGLVDPNRRADAYTETTEVMKQKLLAVGIQDALEVQRKDAKRALMTSFYGSTAVPKEVFGEDTPQLQAFYDAANEVAPGAWELLQDLLNSWQPWALVHAWKLPDGYDAVVKVMKAQEARIEVDELDHASFTYEFHDNVGLPRGKSNVANVTHSVDAYVLRTMHRRCNYDAEMVKEAADLIQMELIRRNLGQPGAEHVVRSDDLQYYIDQYERSTIADIVILPHLNEWGVQCLETKHLQKLMTIIQDMLKHKPFELVTVHDEFKAHANNMNWVRYHYKEILADIADSELLSDLMSQIHGTPGLATKINPQLGDLIRKSNYALC